MKISTAQQHSHQQYYSYLDVLRVLASLAVVVLHVASQVLVKPGQPLDTWMTANVFDSFTRWAVPVFVMISGALLFDKIQTVSLTEFYLRRFKRLLIPLLFWHIVYLDWWYFTSDTPLTPRFVYDLLVFDQPFMHLYFLIVICQLYLLTPWLWWLWQKLPQLGKTVVMMGLVAVTLFWPGSRFIGLIWLPYVSYFVLGYLLRSWRSYGWQLFLPVWLLASIGIAFLTFFLTFLLHASNNLYWYEVNSPLVMVQSAALFLAVASLVKGWTEKKKVIVRTLAATTLGVYLIHPLILYALSVTVVWTNWLIHPVVAISGVAVFSWVLALLISWRLKSHWLIKFLV